MQNLIFILLSIFLLSCNAYKEDIYYGKNLLIEQDSLKVTIRFNECTNTYVFPIKENADLYTAVINKVDTFIVLTKEDKGLFLCLTLQKGVPIKTNIHIFRPDTEHLKVVTYGLSIIISIGLLGLYYWNYKSSWDKHIATKYKEELLAEKSEHSNTTLIFKKQIIVLEKQIDYLQQQLQKRYD